LKCILQYRKARVKLDRKSGYRPLVVKAKLNRTLVENRNYYWQSTFLNILTDQPRMIFSLTLCILKSYVTKYIVPNIRKWVKDSFGLGSTLDLAVFWVAGLDPDWCRWSVMFFCCFILTIVLRWNKWHFQLTKLPMSPFAKVAVAKVSAIISAGSFSTSRCCRTYQDSNTLNRREVEMPPYKTPKKSLKKQLKLSLDISKMGFKWNTRIRKTHDSLHDNKSKTEHWMVSDWFLELNWKPGFFGKHNCNLIERFNSQLTTFDQV
jgi:hypothetical protein